ncbi:MAG: Gfo/Idh/MocA family oxidoreductase, partial [Faecalicoccus sp.]
MRVGTIGSGVIVDRMIDAMKQTKDVEVVAVYSRTKEKAEDYAQKHQIEKSYHDLEKMLQDITIDTIYVASPNSLHFEQSKRALQSGKHVICEKPFTP